MKILIAGSKGYISSHLYNRLYPSYLTTGLEYGQDFFVKDYPSYLINK